LSKTFATKFHHPTFNRSEVIVLTNKQTPLKTSTSLRYATPVDKKLMTILRKSFEWKLFHWIYLHRSFDAGGRVTGRLIVGWTCNVEWL